MRTSRGVDEGIQRPLRQGRGGHRSRALDRHARRQR
jgi:hypothetical protein